MTTDAVVTDTWTATAVVTETEIRFAHSPHMPDRLVSIVLGNEERPEPVTSHSCTAMVDVDGNGHVSVVTISLREGRNR